MSGAHSRCRGVTALQLISKRKCLSVPYISKHLCWPWAPSTDSHELLGAYATSLLHACTHECMHASTFSFATANLIPSLCGPLGVSTVAP